MALRSTYRNPPAVAAPLGRYTHAVRTETGDAAWIHVSGQLAFEPDGTFVGEHDLRRQTERVFENLRLIIEAEGATFADVVKLSTFLTTMEDLDGMREVRSRYVVSDPPASTTVQVTALVLPGAMIEVDLVAVVPS
ncbi:MAG: RidA family protein [Actinomycetota bacterium]